MTDDKAAHNVQIAKTGEAVTAILKTKSDLDHIVQALENRGFRKSDVSVVMPVTDGRAELVFAKETMSYKYAVVGGVSGLVLGALYGWAALNGWVRVPDAELVVERAPWMVLAVTMGAGVFTGATTGGITGLGVPEYVARLCEKSIRGGTMLVAILVDNSKWKQRAIDILKLYRAHDIAANKKVV
ncbi:MAG: hypothetical protein B7Y39_07555 [Bdellovibrio sp. 28-41-41]|nr:MAG: hypothetical protein B7Y39_07555 [Bdellovibrio sp. 28-41-41]